MLSHLWLVQLVWTEKEKMISFGLLVGHFFYKQTKKCKHESDCQVTYYHILYFCGLCTLIKPTTTPESTWTRTKTLVLWNSVTLTHIAACVWIKQPHFILLCSFFHLFRVVLQYCIWLITAQARNKMKCFCNSSEIQWNSERFSRRLSGPGLLKTY